MKLRLAVEHPFSGYSDVSVFPPYTHGRDFMKKVLMIAYTDYRYDARIRREAETLSRTNEFQVAILTLMEGERPRCFEMGGVRVIEVKQKKYDGESKLRYILSYLQFFLRCAVISTRVFFKGDADIIHVHNMPDILVFSAMVPRILGCKLILDIHDSMPETYLSKYAGYNSAVFKLLCLEESVSAVMAHRVICVNAIQKEVVAGRGIKPDKITISMNVPDPILFPVLSRSRNGTKTDRAFRMIYHGTIADRLGVDLVVQAMARIAGRVPELQFHIWGKATPALDDIERLGNELNVADRLHVLRGGVPLEKLADELRIMDIGVIGNRKGGGDRFDAAGKNA